jgi:pilus assembly protein CpaB
VNYSVRNIAISIVMAIAAALAVLVYTTSYKQSVTHGQERIKVLVATRDIPAGTPGEDAGGGMRLQEVLASDRAPGALTSTGGLAGKVAAQTIYAGEQVVAATFQPPTTQAPSLQLARTERAVRVNCDRASCVLGQVKPGDHVDVFGTFKVKDPLGTDAQVTRLLLPDVRVLEVPAEDKKKGLSSGPADKQDQVMLAVDQKTAAKLAYLEGLGQNGGGGGQIWLALRPPDAAAQEQPVAPQTLESMLLDDLPDAQVKALITRYGQHGSGAGASANGHIGG